LLAWALSKAPLQEIWDTLKQLQLWQILVLLASNGIVFALITARWWVIVRAEKSTVPYLPLIGYRLSSFGLSYFTPGPQIGGETLQVFYLQRKYGLTFARATAAVMMDKLIELVGNVIFLVIGLATVFSFGFFPWSNTQITGAAIPVGAILLWPPIHIFLIYHGHYPISILVRAIQPRLPESNWIKKAIRLLVVSEHLAGTFIHRHFGAALVSLGFSLFAWAGFITEYWLIAHFLQLDLTVLQALAGLTASQVAFLVPVPAGIGALEASQIFALGIMGFPASAGISMSLVIRARDLFFGGLGLIRAGKI
jgi:uncharacterized protein (TIRG00374 family)